MAQNQPDTPASGSARGVMLAVAAVAVLGGAAWLALRPGDVPPSPMAPTAPAPPPVASPVTPPPSAPAQAATAPSQAPQPPLAEASPAVPQSAPPLPPLAAAPLFAVPQPPPPSVAPPSVAPPAATPSPPAAMAPAAQPAPPPAPARAQANVPIAAPAPPAAPPAAVASPTASQPSAPVAEPARPVAVVPPPPQFDIVRVNPQGQAVIAGRGVPGSEVILRASGEEIGRVIVDRQGQWVLVGGTPLPPGSHEITLSMRVADGAEIPGSGTVLVAVAHPSPPSVSAAPAARAPDAAPAAPPTAPIVVMTTPQGAPQLVQAPGRAGTGKRLGLDLVDYDDDGEIRFAGTALPGTIVRVYVDDVHVGDATAGADGRWSIVPGARVAQGDHRLRLDQVDAAGRVAGRVELPFQRAAVVVAEPAGLRVVVQPKQSLWRIARRAYGKGVRYTEIFAANRDQITDPNRIYPGQVFAVPGAATPAAGSTPSSASRSR